MHRPLAIGVAVVMLLACGVVHGLRADRWRQTPELGEAVARADTAPLQAGRWKVETMEGDPRAFEQAGAQAWWVRQYKHPRWQTPVTVVLMCGRAGRMSVHTPEVCYQGAGFQLYDTPVATPVRAQGGDELGTFLTARFTKSSGRGSDLRLYWAWSSGGPWTAPTNPRWEFRGAPFLYKLYLSHDASSSAPSGADEDAALALLRDLGPELQKALVLGQEPR